MLRRAIVPLVLLVGCERAEPPEEAPSLLAPDASEDLAIESTARVNDPPPPAAAPISELLRVTPGSKRWFLALTPNERHVVREICRARRRDPCLGMLPIMNPGETEPRPGPLDDLLAELGANSDGVDTFCFEANGRRGCVTPLVVAFDDQPIELVPSRQTFAFEPGKPIASEWPTAATPWIALDRDGDGAITSGAELFGNSTGGATNGFEALAQLDANHDGVIDRADPMFASLLLWADANSDHRSSPDELSPLARVVTAIPLAHAVDGRTLRGAMTWTGGTGAVVDVYLTTTQ